MNEQLAEFVITHQTPALAYFKNKMWMVFVEDEDNDLRICSTVDGVSWTEPVRLIESVRSDSSPSMAVSDDGLTMWVAYAQLHGGQMAVTSSKDGLGWTKGFLVGGEAINRQSSPSIVWFENSLRLVFMAANDSHSLLICSSADGQDWEKKTQSITKFTNSRAHAGSSPALAVFDCNLWMAFVADNESYNVLIGSSADGTTWPSFDIVQLGKAKSWSSPGLAVFENKLWMTVTAEDGNVVVNSMDMNRQWSGYTPIPSPTGGHERLMSGSSPAICASTTGLWLSFIRANNNDLRVLAPQHDTTWSEARLVEWYSNRQTIAFSNLYPAKTFNLSIDFNNIPRADYDATFGCWIIKEKAPLYLNLDLPTECGVDLIFRLKQVTQSEVFGCPLSLVINGKEFTRSDKEVEFMSVYEDIWSVPVQLLKRSGNKIVIKTDEGSDVGISYATADFATLPADHSEWMRALPDTILLSEINIPGTHDSAAINTSYYAVPLACHLHTITEQLNGGIRMLDVRLKVIKTDNQLLDEFTFKTCHDDFLSSIGFNEFQSLDSLLNECLIFLKSHATEVIIMSLKVDDWNGIDKALHDTVLTQLGDSFDRFVLNDTTRIPMVAPVSKTNQSLGSVRGRVVLFNRINRNFPKLGVPIFWKDNTTGEYATPLTGRGYKVYVQDNYNTVEQAKYEATILAMQSKEKNEVLINYASGIMLYTGVYIMQRLLNYFGNSVASERPKNIGWTLFDYPFWVYNTNDFRGQGYAHYGSLSIVMLIISSNFSYAGYRRQFRTIVYELPVI